MFRAFAEWPANRGSCFSIPPQRGTPLLLLDAAKAYHCEVERSTAAVPDSVRKLLVGAHLEGWREACEAAGLQGSLFHEALGSAQAGIPRPVAVPIIGHNTESLYRRYGIVSGQDLSNVAEQMERFISAQRFAKLKRVN